jgi:diguanylate cyclase (GGDEF)-like protein/PAS domain S-box-containing protein
MVVREESFVKREIVTLVYANAVPSSIGILVISMAVWIGLRGSVDPSVMDPWAVWMALVAFHRLYLKRRYSISTTPPDPDGWARRLVVNTTAAGIGWMVLSLMAIMVKTPQAEVAIVMVVLGVLAATVPVLSPLLSAFFSSSVPPAIALLVSLSIQLKEMAAILIPALLLFIVMIYYFALRTNRNLIEGLKLRFQKDQLVSALNVEIGERELAQKELVRYQSELEALVLKRTRELEEMNQDLKKEVAVRQQSEQALTEAQKRFVAVMDSLEAIVYVADFDTHEMLFMNRYCKDIFGDRVGEQCWSILQSNQTGPCEFCTNDKLLNDQGNPTGLYCWEFQNTKTNDWFDCRDQAIRWPDGRIVRMEIASNINASKGQQEVINRQKSYLQNIIDSIPDPLMVASKGDRIDLMNRAAREYMASTREVVKRMLSGKGTAKETDNNNGLLCSVADVLSEGKTLNGLFEHQMRDRSRRFFEMNASPLSNGVDEKEGVVQVLRDVTDHIAIQEQLENKKDELNYLAYHDVLTELPNRLLFLDRLNQSIIKAHRNGSMLAVLFIDLDRFKEINDSLGHSVGDAVLRQIASRLGALVRSGDTIGRLGGDEFALLVDSIVHPEDASIVAEKILEYFSSPMQIEGRDFVVSASIGISLYPQDGTDPLIMLKNADAAMYRAKSEGRSRFQYYSAEMTEKAYELVFLEADLRKAIKSNQLEVYYQPQIDLSTGVWVGAEALVRWNHPEKGLLLPKAFISVAEHSGVIRELTGWVLMSACAQFGDWMRSGLKLGTLSVNISGKCLSDEGFLQTVLDILSETGCKPYQLVLEITESFLMLYDDRTIGTLIELANHGIKISIDDFGTGYSSLSHIRELPISQLKIDKSFVVDIPGDHNDVAIVNAIIAMAKSLQLKIVAEGVEDQTQREMLISCGCELGQGFLYSPPVSARKFQSLAKSACSTQILQ